MSVGDGGTVILYGCFLSDETTSALSGTFVDGTYLEIATHTIDGGRILPTSVSEQECDTAPSIAPTNFPTMSESPTVTPPKNGGCFSTGGGGYYHCAAAPSASLLVTMVVYHFIHLVV